MNAAVALPPPPALAVVPAEMSDDDLFALIPEGNDWTQYEQKTTAPHTAQRLKKNDPFKYETLKRAIHAGAALKTLARTHKVGINTLYAIIDAELGGQDKYHQRLAGKFKMAMNLGVDTVIEMMPNAASLTEASIATGVMADKALALAGLPTAIVEVRHTVDNGEMEKFNAELANLRAARAAREAVTIEADIVPDATPDALPTA